MKEYDYFKIDLHLLFWLLHLVRYLPSPVCGTSENFCEDNSTCSSRKKKYWRSKVAGKGLFMDLTTARDGRNEAGGR